MIKAGDYVVHSMEGVCKVKAIVDMPKGRERDSYSGDHCAGDDGDRSYCGKHNRGDRRTAAGSDTDIGTDT